MRVSLTGLLVFFSTITLAGPVPAQSGKNPLDKFVGTWVFESERVANEKPIELFSPKEPRSVLLITGPHFIYGRVLPATMKLTELRHAGQLLYDEESKVFEEVMETPAEKAKAFSAIKWRFRLSLDDKGRLTKISTVGSGPAAGTAKTQVFVRFDPSPKTADETDITLGQRLLDLKKAYDAGVLTEAEFQKAKAKLLESN